MDEGPFSLKASSLIIIGTVEWIEFRKLWVLDVGPYYCKERHQSTSGALEIFGTEQRGVN